MPRIGDEGSTAGGQGLAVPRWVLAVGSGVLLTLIDPPFALSPLAWVALTPLLIAIERARGRAAFMLGWLTGTIGALGVTGFWIQHAAREYFGASPLTAAVFTFAVTQIFVSVYFALFAWAVAVVDPRRGRPLVIAALFVATEYARAHLWSGNPWELLGHSQRNVMLIQFTDLSGVYGLSFLLALSAASVAELRRSRWPAVATAAAIVVVLAYGAWRLAMLPAEGQGPRLELVQGNLSNALRGRPDQMAEQLEHYLELSRSAAAPAPDLVIWPENAVPFFPDENPALAARITEQMRVQHAALLTGAPRAGERPGVAALYNSVYLFTADGFRSVYDKRKLLPFVERLPLRSRDGPYLAGVRRGVFDHGGVRFGVLICYEAIYSEMPRDLVRDGAQILLNLSNDSWFEAGAGPEQHYAIARFGAVENRRSLVRVTNSGITAAFDPAGREITRLPQGEALAESLTVPVGTGSPFYNRYGDVFALFCLATAGVLLIDRGWAMRRSL